MTQEQFTLLLTDQQQTDKTTLAQLQNIARDFPWCQPARILLAKNLQYTDREAFEKQVNQASAYATDRRKFQAIFSDRRAAYDTVANKDREHAENPGQQKNPGMLIHAATEQIKPAPVRKTKKGWLVMIRSILGLQQATPQIATLPSGENPLLTSQVMHMREKLSAQQQIIERFLQDEPRIEFKKEMFSEENLAVKSVADNQELVSETLAQVLVKQGKKERALDIYKKLSLKYPEKSSYFAKIMASLTNETT